LRTALGLLCLLATLRPSVFKPYLEEELMCWIVVIKWRGCSVSLFITPWTQKKCVVAFYSCLISIQSAIVDAKEEARRTIHWGWTLQLSEWRRHALKWRLGSWLLKSKINELCKWPWLKTRMIVCVYPKA
jgi:hypothetical protein